MNFLHISGVQLVPEVERAVVGIVREALQNVRKHSRAHSVKLEVRRAEDELRVYVSDDGVGMADQTNTDGHQSFGIELMRELAEDLGGTVQIVSDAGQGTRSGLSAAGIACGRRVTNFPLRLRPASPSSTLLAALSAPAIVNPTHWHRRRSA